MISLGGSGVSVLLMGTGTYTAGTPQSMLPPIPAVHHTLDDLRDVLVQRCQVNSDPDNLRVVEDPTTSHEMGLAVVAAAKRAEELLFVYYVGHGLVSADGVLYLAATGTDQEDMDLPVTALPYSTVRNALMNSSAKTIVVILDCCFSGRAVGVLSSSTELGPQLARYDGGFVLAAAGRDHVALAPPGSRHTAFTGELINLLRDGDPGGSELITLDAAARYLERTLPAKGFPRPRWMGSDRADELVLATNPAFWWRSSQRGPTHVVETGQTDPSEEVCPYPGLTAFQPEDARWFFGRERLTSELVRTVAAAMASERCTAVIGPSGAGKSSLLRAGLLPAIAQGALPAPGASTWPTLVVTLTATPMRSLVNGLATAAGWDPDTIWEQIARDPARVVDAMRVLLVERADRGDRRGARLVLVVDQLEELFTACPDRHERDRFITVLATAAAGSAENATGKEPVALVVFSLRSDFYTQAAEYGELRTALQEGQVLVGPMRQKELAAAIREPAEVVGLRVEPGLVELLVRDVGAAEGAMGQGVAQGAVLPLLAHALRQTWQHRQGRTLTVDGYTQTGGVSGALAKTAEEVYASLDAAGQRTAERLLVRLVQLGENTRDTRRRMDVSVLCAGLPAAERVLEALTDARLVVVEEGFVHLAHEALISAWDRLRLALDTDRWRLVESQKVAAEAERWDRAARDPSFLLRGARLASARELRVGPDQPGNLTPLAEALLDESIEREVAEGRGVRRRTRIVRSAVSLAAVLVVVAVAAVSWGVTSSWAEQERLHVSASREAAAKSIALRVTQPGEAMLLAVAAWRLAPTPEARGALLSTQSQPFVGVLSVPGRDPVSSLAAHPASGLVAVAQGSFVEVWDVSRRQRTRVAELPSYSSATQLAFTPDGALLVGTDQSGVRIWDVRAGRLRGEPILAPKGDGYDWSEFSEIAVNPADGSVALYADSVTRAGPSMIKWMDPATQQVIRTLRLGIGNLAHLAYTPDGRTLVAVTRQDPRVVLLDPVTGQVKAAMKGSPADILDLAVQPSGSLLATANSDGTTQLWDLSTATPAGGPLDEAEYGNAVTGVAFSPDGELLATTSHDGTVRLWDVHARWQLGELLTGHPDQVKAVVFGPDNHTLLGADAVVWNLRHLPALVHAGTANAVAFRPGGRQLATAGSDGNVLLWDVVRWVPIGRLSGHTGSLRAVAFNQQGTLLVTGGDNDTVLTWNVETREQVGPALAGPPQGTRTVAFSPDGSMLAAAGGEGTIRLWEANGTKYQDFHVGGEVRGRYRVSFSPDNSRLTATSRDFRVGYDRQTRDRLGEPQPANFPPGAAPAVEAGDGSARATVSDDEFVRLWDSQNRLQATLSGHRDVVLDAAFSDDRHTLATVSRDGALMVWDTNPDRVAIEVCEALGVDLTLDQWKSYITDLPYQKVCDQH